MFGGGRDLSGVWVGEYAYDPAPGIPPGRPPVPFTLVLRQLWFGRFRGEVRDDPRRGMPEVGVVKGRCRGDRLSFVKQMPVCYLTGPTGSVSLRTHLREQKGILLPRDIEHPPIFYEGDLAEDGVAEGTWRLEARTVPLWLLNVTISFGRLTGTWRMEREPE